VVLAGDAAKVVLRGAAGSFGEGEVPAGDYTAEVSFADGTTIQVPRVSVKVGGSTTLKCSASFGNCKVI
jgi:hypothetical protein